VEGEETVKENHKTKIYRAGKKKQFAKKIPANCRENNLTNYI